MSADLLREAAALMHDRAQFARAGNWVAHDSEEIPGASVVSAEWQDDLREIATVQGSAPQGNGINADHIASWHPVVALAVADWLDCTARYLQRGKLPMSRDLHAIRLARAYLGRDA